MITSTYPQNPMYLSQKQNILAHTDVLKSVCGRINLIIVNLSQPHNCITGLVYLLSGKAHTKLGYGEKTPSRLLVQKTNKEVHCE